MSDETDADDCTDRDEELPAALEEGFGDVDRETRRRHHDLKSSIRVEPEVEIPVEAYRTARAVAEDTGERVDSFLLDYLDLDFHFMVCGQEVNRDDE